MKYLLWIIGKPPLPVTLITIEAYTHDEARRIANAAINTWVKTENETGFNTDRPKAYLVPDWGEWL